MDTTPDVAGITTLDALRATIREKMLDHGDILAAKYTSQDVADLEALAETYVALGGNLELTRRPDAVNDALARLAAVAGDYTVEDFPDRLRPLAVALNELGKELARSGITGGRG